MERNESPGNDRYTPLRFQYSRRLEATHRILAAFAGVGFSADTVHGDGQSGVRLCGNRTKRHCAGGKTFDDFFRRLDFCQSALARRRA